MVRDHGSLAALTADFDAHFVGNVAKVLTMAAVSTPGNGGGGGGGDQGPAPAGGGGIPPDEGPMPPGGDGVLVPPDGGSPDSPSGNPPGGGGGPGGGEGGQVDSDRPRGDGDVLGEETDSPGLGDLPTDIPTEGTAGGAGGAGGSSSGGGTLPFTGYAAAMAAFIGASLATTGVAIRAKLQRREP